MRKREAAAAIERDRDFKTSHFMANSEPSWYAELDSGVGPEAGSRAAWLIDVLVQSNRIYDFYRRGEAGEVPGFYENNRYREEHLKDLCLAKYRDAERIDPSPRALMKFGSWHLYQGLSPTRIHTIGDFFANVARFNGHDFLSVIFVSMPADADSYSSDTGYAWPFIKDLDPTRLRVIDLRPFRHYRNRAELEKAAGDAWRDEYKEDFVRLVYGYDLLFFVGESKSATFSVVPRPE